MSALDYFSSTSVIRIATRGRDGDEIVRPIWSVVVGGIPYIRNGYGASAVWYRRLRRTDRAEFVDGTTRYLARVELVEDEETKRAVDQAYQAKYAASGAALARMVSDTVRDDTLRVLLDDD